MNKLANLLIPFVLLFVVSVSRAQTVIVPQPPPAPTPKPQMSRETIEARRRFYVARYRQIIENKLKGSLVADFGPDNTTSDYASWLSLALRNHPNTRYFKMKADLSAGMHSWTDVWVYDRRIRQLRYLQRVYDGSGKPSKATSYRIYQNVDDAAIHVLAEDNRPLSKVASYSARR